MAERRAGFFFGFERAAGFFFAAGIWRGHLRRAARLPCLSTALERARQRLGRMPLVSRRGGHRALAFIGLGVLCDALGVLFLILFAL